MMHGGEGRNGEKVEGEGGGILGTQEPSDRLYHCGGEYWYWLDSL